MLGWTARETAEAVSLSVPAVNSALQRARPVLREHLPPHRCEWSAASTAQEQALLRKYVAAWDAADAEALAALMHEDIRITMPPYPFWFEGADAIRSLTANLDPTHPVYRGSWRFRPTTLNRQPTLAAYLQPTG
ncbi:nuclear transport factor 2 family protein [Kribbella turkmenica]|uniref:nuclear transport factor 2 family protein n=1 Tax=Kribbella turkmenica TaxID=2530375 RepID=UPI001F361D50|nr:nuclear transport factor 2 family protein [Kribbella turkmenica]